MMSAAQCDFVLRGAAELVTMAGGAGGSARGGRSGAAGASAIGAGDAAAAEAALGTIMAGALLARAGEVAWVGAEAELTRAVDAAGERLVVADDALVLDAQGAAVVPGFVDSHTHAVFAGSRADEYAARLAGVSYSDILAGGGGINSTVRATRAATGDELAALTRARLDSFVCHGTTTLEIKSGYGLTLADERKLLAAAVIDHPTRRVLTFLGAHFVPPEFRDDRRGYLDHLGDDMLPACAGEAEFCDVFCDEGAFTVAESRRVLARARELGYGLKIHADELAPSGGSQLAAELGCVSADHLVYAGAGEMKVLEQAGVVAVCLPGTSFTLGAPYAPAKAFLEAGLTVALASDFNPGTCYCENLQTIIALACQQDGLTPAQALRAVTAGGAAALRRAGEIGGLTRGHACDLLVLDAESHHELPYHFGVNLVRGVVIGGRLVVADGRRVVDGDGERTVDGGAARTGDRAAGKEQTS